MHSILRCAFCFLSFWGTPAVPVAYDAEQNVICKYQFTNGAGDKVIKQFTIVLRKEWSPLGFLRFVELVNDRFYDKSLIYRVMPGYVIQWGAASDPNKTSEYHEKPIKDDLKPLDFPFRKGNL
jgi:hypothetical protein